MVLTAFGKFLTSNSAEFPDSDQIAVGLHFIYVMQDSSRLQYANKTTLALVGSVTISISITDENLPGMVWWDHKLYLPDNFGNLYYLSTDPSTGVPSTTLTKIATLPNFGSGTNAQTGFDFGRKYIIYKTTGSSTCYYIDIFDTTKTGVYATASGTTFAGSMYASNFFVDCEGYMYLGIGDNPNPDVRILKPQSSVIPMTYVHVKDVVSNVNGGILCDGLYPDPFNAFVIYTNNDDQTICLYEVVGFLSVSSVNPPSLPAQIIVPKYCYGDPINVSWTKVDFPIQGNVNIDYNQTFYEISFYNGSTWSLVENIYNSTYMIYYFAKFEEPTSTNFRIRTFVISEGDRYYSWSGFLTSQPILVIFGVKCQVGGSCNERPYINKAAFGIFIYFNMDVM